MTPEETQSLKADVMAFARQVCDAIEALIARYGGPTVLMALHDDNDPEVLAIRTRLDDLGAQLGA